MTPALPIRFLGVVLGGWVCVRAALLAPGWIDDELEAAPAPAPPHNPPLRLAPAPLAVLPLADAPLLGRAPSHETPSATAGPIEPVGGHSGRPEKHFVAAELAPAAIAQALLPTPTGEESQAPRPLHSPSVVPAAALPQPPAAVGRWSASAWAFVREGEAPQLAPGGTLGGSQLGARIGYRLNGEPVRPLSLHARAYTPLERPRAAELAVGIDWKPVAALPVRLLAERRQAVGEGGRSAFSLAAYGGVSGVKVAGPVALEAYAQAGIVGAGSRDLFADASVALAIPLTERIGIGGAAWAGAQPALSRLDAGPQLSMRLPGPAQNVRLLAEWRFRIVGDAAPGSGPALTLATDF